MVAASARLSAYSATTTPMVTVTAVLGPYTSPRVPPKREAKMPTATAPYSPATGPKPDKTP